MKHIGPEKQTMVLGWKKLKGGPYECQHQKFEKHKQIKKLDEYRRMIAG